MNNLIKTTLSALFLILILGACTKSSLDFNATSELNLDNNSTFGVLDNVQEAKGCTTIQSGKLKDTAGDVIKPGYNKWGHNYLARTFNGLYCDSYRDASWCQVYKDVRLQMKWNDAWLSNQDCDKDGNLDRHYGHVTYRGSGAWLTNHQSGEYYDDDGNLCKWNYFVKIIAAPADAYIDGGFWYNADGTEIGEVIWGQFAIIQTVENDPCAGRKGLQYNSPDHSGLGSW